VRNLATLEDDMVDRTLGKAVAHRQSAMSGTDHDRGGVQHHQAPSSFNL
jgi:hypothetical protein